MKKLLLILSLLTVPVVAQAQTPIVIGPSTQFAWDVVAPTPAFAQGLTYVLTTSTTPLVTQTLTNVVCVVSAVVGTQTCNVLASVIPLGSRTVTMTASDGVVTSLPSAPFTYVDLVIPVPSGLRFK